MKWHTLENTYKDAGIVPVLGAGVSMESGLPNWAELLTRVARRCTPRGGRTLIRDLRRENFSLPAIAGMLRALRPDVNFAEVVREELYRTFPTRLRQSTPESADALVAFVKARNRTLRATAALCAIATGQPRFVKNPRIHAIVNFNVDAVLREYVEACYGYPLVRTVERPSKEPNRKKIDVYHMHGLLRFDSKAGARRHEGADKLVLGEQDYFDFFNNPTGLFNYTFLYLLRQHACLFVGLSMQDDNIRRLLYYSTKERVQAYQEEGKSAAQARLRAIRHFAIIRQYRSRSVNTAIEQSLAELGTHVLWVKEYREIPKRFAAMYAAGGNDWSTVY